MFQEKQPIKLPVIYKITVKRHDKDDRFYIGQTVNFHERKLHHLWELSNGRHKNKILQSAYDFYGNDAFSFSVLDYCQVDKFSMAEIEKKRIDEQIASTGIDSIYNILIDSVISRAGIPHSLETRKKMSDAKKAIPRTEEQKEAWIKILKSKTGKKLSPESIAKRTEKQKGMKRTDETKRKMSEAQTGKKLSPETIAKISATKKAQKRTMSPELKEKLKAINSARKIPEELKQKLILMKLGVKKSPEEIARRQATRAANKLKKLADMQHGINLAKI